MKKIIPIFFLLLLGTQCINKKTENNVAFTQEPEYIHAEVNNDSIEDVSLTETPIDTVYSFTEELLPELPYERNDIIYIAYNQIVEGYRLRVTCSPYELRINGFASAMMEFHNIQSGIKLYAFNPNFSDKCLRENDLDIVDNNSIQLDYNTFQLESGFYYYAPFQFRDMDFDGKKELLISNWNAAQRGCNAYDVYKIKNNRLHLLEFPPFDRIDDITTIDNATKTIIIHHSGGASYWVDEYYKANSKGQFKLIKKEELAGYTFNIENINKL